MGEPREQHMLQEVKLGMNGGVDTGMGMAEKIYPPGTDGIEITLAVEIFEPHAFAPPHRDQRQALVVLHLGAGMPEHREIPLYHLVIRSHKLISRLGRLLLGKTDK